MKFALITADAAHKRQLYLNGESSDGTSFMNWTRILKGIHLSFISLREEDNAYLKDFDVVMMSGHLRYVEDIVRIGNMLKGTKTVTIFYPEGSLQLYDNSVLGFHKTYYDTWAACDIVSSAEEDKISYYEALVPKSTIVRFIHVPISREMEDGMFQVPRGVKDPDLCVVYGDNNPNHPVVALACAQKMTFSVFGVDLRQNDLKELFPGVIRNMTSKLAQYPFLRLLGRSIIHFYPTEWIGTARQPVACAAVGTPCIGNHDSHTQRRLFPELCSDIYDVKRMTDLARTLMKDTKFYSQVVNFARANLHFYGLEATLKRFNAAIDDARALKHRRAVSA